MPIQGTNRDLLPFQQEFLDAAEQKLTDAPKHTRQEFDAFVTAHNLTYNPDGKAWSNCPQQPDATSVNNSQSTVKHMTPETDVNKSTKDALIKAAGKKKLFIIVLQCSKVELIFGAATAEVYCWGADADAQVTGPTGSHIWGKFLEGAEAVPHKEQTGCALYNLSPESNIAAYKCTVNGTTELQATEPTDLKTFLSHLEDQSVDTKTLDWANHTVTISTIKDDAEEVIDRTYSITCNKDTVFIAGQKVGKEKNWKIGSANEEDIFTWAAVGGGEKNWNWKDGMHTRQLVYFSKCWEYQDCPHTLEYIILYYYILFYYIYIIYILQNIIYIHIHSILICSIDFGVTP